MALKRNPKANSKKSPTKNLPPFGGQLFVPKMVATASKRKLAYNERPCRSSQVFPSLAYHSVFNTFQPSGVKWRVWTNQTIAGPLWTGKNLKFQS